MPFADVMVEDAAGHRVLLAPSERVRDFVAATYSFDEHVIEPVTVEDTADGWQVSTPSLSLRLVTGGRTPLGALLTAVPSRLATSPAWCSVVDPVARVVLRGVRTRGTAGNDRREWYGATSVVAVTAISGRWRGADLGALDAGGPAVPVRLLQHAQAPVGDERRDHDRAGCVDRLATAGQRAATRRTRHTQMRVCVDLTDLRCAY